jgi:hypothetical protein
MLPAALSEALGISLADVMDRYFDGSEESERVHRIEEALDWRRPWTGGGLGPEEGIRGRGRVVGP